MHRVKAVRASFPTEEEEEEEDDKPKERTNIRAGVLGDPETPSEGDIESSRLGSQQCLAGKQREQVTEEKEKKKERDYLCGLCSSKRPAASVWNCDGEILPYTQILCR